MNIQENPNLPSVYVIGDSISLHYGPYLEKYIAGSFLYDRKSGEAEAMLNLDDPTGANGGDSSMVLRFLEAKLADPHFAPDAILLNCGLHDIKVDLASHQIQIPLDSYRTNLEKIIFIIRTRQLRPIWIRTTPVVDAVHNRGERKFHRFSKDNLAYNAVADEIMAHDRVPMIDLHSFTQNLGADIFCDHVHFPEHIREKQAAFIAGWLQAWWAAEHRAGF